MSQLGVMRILMMLRLDHLVSKFSFDGNIEDSKNGITDGVGTNVTYEAGIKGEAYKGSSSSFIAYNTCSKFCNKS